MVVFCRVAASSNNAVNSDAFFVRCARYKCGGYGWR